MKRNNISIIGLIVVCISLMGCATPHLSSNILKPDKNYMQTRQLQMRQYDTVDENKMLLASAGVLQDMGFTIDDSETNLGVIVASKNRGAMQTKQVAGRIAFDAFAGLLGVQANTFESADREQKIKVSVVTNLNADGKKTLVRVTFQRIVWDFSGKVSKMESLKNPELYSGFYEKLSKAVFLEEQKI